MSRTPTILPAALVVDALAAQWTTLDQLASSLDDAEWQAASILPGWTIADVIAHIIGTESMLAGREVAATRDVAALAHVRNPIGELNERWLDHFRGHDRESVMAAYREIVGVRTAALQGATDEDFAAETATPAGPDTYGRFMRIRVFDCWVHEVDIRDSTDKSLPVDPVPARLALDEIAASLPFVIGKRAGLPAGSTVLIRVTGLVSRDFRISVAERASLVDEFEGGDDSADVRLSVDIADLARLAGGRTSADPQRVRIEGDTALGERIVENLAYMI